MTTSMGSLTIILLNSGSGHIHNDLHKFGENGVILLQLRMLLNKFLKKLSTEFFDINHIYTPLPRAARPTYYNRSGKKRKGAAVW